MIIKDWFHKQPLEADIKALQDYVMAKLEHAIWGDSHESQAPGSRWCLIELDPILKTELENGTGIPIYPEFYVWDYRDVKTLKVHRDTNDRGGDRKIAGCIPLFGDFEVHAYSPGDLTIPVDRCVYGPGEFLVLNNTKYFHGGRVLSDTRLSLHFYFDIMDSKNTHLQEVLQNNRRRVGGRL